MAIRRAMATVVALVVAATFAASGIAAQQAKPDNKQKRSKQEQAEIEQLVKLVDGVMTGATPSPVSTVTWSRS